MARKLKDDLSSVTGVHIDDDKKISAALKEFDKAGRLDLRTLHRIVFTLADHVEKLIK